MRKITQDRLAKVSLLILLFIIISVFLAGCATPSPWVQEAEDRQERVITAPIDMSHCEGNTIYMGKPKC